MSKIHDKDTFLGLGVENNLKTWARTLLGFSLNLHHLLKNWGFPGDWIQWLNTHLPS